MTGEPLQPRYLVKVGGSVIDDGRASAAIASLPLAMIDVVFVAGGGARADAVRAAQKRDGFDDRTAHRDALQAMNDMASVLAREMEGFETVATVEDMTRVLASGRRPVLQPLPTLSSDPLLPETWDATSDAIAARLAEIVGTAVVLIKSVDTPETASAADLAAAGIVDDEFPRIVRRSFLKWAVVGPSCVSSDTPEILWHQG